MAVEVAALVARLEADVRDFERGMKQAEKRLDSLERETQKTDATMGRMRAGFNKFAIAAAAGYGLRKLGGFMFDAAKSASNLEESVNAVRVVFGDAADTVLRFAADTEDAVFVAESELNQLATVTGSLLQNFGFNAQQAADETVTLTKRAADMASVFNVDVGEALTAINAALRGETEPIRRFGVNVDEATTKARALELGLIGSGDALDMNAKVAARMNLILEQTAKVQGDAENTAGSFANQMRKLEEQVEAAKAQIGEQLLPVLVDLIPILIDVASFAAEAGLKLAAAFGSDSARHAIRVKEAVEEVNAALGVGKDPATAYAEGLEKLARKGLITAANLEKIAQASGATDEQIMVATEAVLNYVTSVHESSEAMGRNKDFQKDWVKTGILTGEKLAALQALFDELNVAAETAGRQGFGTFQRAAEGVRSALAGLDPGAFAGSGGMGTFSALDRLQFHFRSLGLGFADFARVVEDAQGFGTFDKIGAGAEQAASALAEEQKVLEENAKAHEEWQKRVDAAINGAVQLFGDFPKKVKVNIAKATEALEAQALRSRGFDELFKGLGDTGARLLADQLLQTFQSNPDLAFAAAQAYWNNLETAFRAEINLSNAITDNAQRLATQESIVQAMIDAGISWATILEQNFDPNLIAEIQVRARVRNAAREAPVTVAPNDLPTINPYAGIGTFHSGGVVPGPRGANVPIIAAGGETVLPTHDPTFGMGGDTYITLQVGGETLEEFVIKATDKARRRGRV